MEALVHHWYDALRTVKIHMLTTNLTLRGRPYCSICADRLLLLD
jgi:hypothetical protein